MTGREDWLALTQEPALDPEQRICDPHHHFWIYPGSRYLAEEFLQELDGGHQVLSTVFVECLQFYDESAPTQLRPVGETIAVDRIAREAVREDGPDLAAGIVGFADMMLGDDVRPVLDAHINASRRFRGVRHATAWHKDDKIHDAHTKPVENQMGMRSFRAGLKQLVKLGLSFDAWLYQTQLPELTNLANAIPDLNIVLNHMAGPLGIGPYQDRRELEFGHWKEQMKTLSACENVSVKLGGRAATSSGFGWSKRSQPPGSEELAEAIAPYFETCVDFFAPERCMFESNFPVDKAGCSYTVLWNAYKRFARRYSEAERDLLFHDTATQFYRLDN